MGPWYIFLVMGPVFRRATCLRLVPQLQGIECARYDPTAAVVGALATAREIDLLVSTRHCFRWRKAALLPRTVFCTVFRGPNFSDGRVGAAATRESAAT
jgi:hypothetical protein